MMISSYHQGGTGGYPSNHKATVTSRFNSGLVTELGCEWERACPRQPKADDPIKSRSEDPLTDKALHAELSCLLAGPPTSDLTACFITFGVCYCNCRDLFLNHESIIFRSPSSKSSPEQSLSQNQTPRRKYFFHHSTSFWYFVMSMFEILLDFT